jgi:uncharacterized protein
MQAGCAADKMEEVPSIFASREVPEFIVLCLVLTAQAGGTWWILTGPAAGAPRWARRAIIGVCLTAFALETFASLLRFDRVSRHFPAWFEGWGRGAVISLTMLSLSMLAAAVVASALSRIVLRNSSRHSAARRGFLRVVQTALLAAPAAAIGYGVFVERMRLTMREETIAIAGLPEDLDGLRLVQITDIHLSPFLSERELARAVDMANETKAHLALMTGDMITTRHDPLDAGLRQIARLRSDAGIFCCMGNHEEYSGVQTYATEQGARLGLRFLRSQAAALRFGSTIFNLAGVDYQRLRRPYLVGAERLIRPGAFNVLLSHNPDVFPVAARQGYKLVVSGHTHGGQVRVEILREDLNIARFFTHYVDGLYQEGPASIFVSRGLGTIGVPARLGATPEVALLHLCRT